MFHRNVLIAELWQGYQNKNAPTAAPRPTKAGATVFNGAAAPVACGTDPEAPEMVEDGAAAIPKVPEPAPDAAPVTDALPLLSTAAADAPSFSVPAVMTRG
jgi:hypothetical protein